MLIPISANVWVSKDGIEVVTNSVSVLSSRGVARPDWHVKFCQIIYVKFFQIIFKFLLQKSHWPYDVNSR